MFQLSQRKDPCDYISEQGPDAFQRLLDKSVDALEYKWQLALQAQRDADSPAGQHRAIEQFLSALARSARFGSSDPVWRGLLLNHISKLLSMSPAQVLTVVNQLKSRSTDFRPASSAVTASVSQTQPPLTALDKALITSAQ